MGTIYRNYKDNVFCLLHRDRRNLLELYNGLNGTDYGNADDLAVVTLSDAICIQYRNDAAYTFNNDLSLYEQQSTENPNIPLRLLHYISEEYRHIISAKELYRQSMVKIPTPHFVIFYNGTKPQPERRTYRLSDLYQNPMAEPELELRATVLNINPGNNEELLRKCGTLHGYMEFVRKVRDKKAHMGTEEAVRGAVSECIREGILRDFFTSHKEEVIGVSIFEFDEELYKQAMREDGIEIGKEEGRKEGIIEGRKEGVKEGENLFASLTAALVKERRYADLDKAVNDIQYRNDLYRGYGLL